VLLFHAFVAARLRAGRDRLTNCSARPSRPLRPSCPSTIASTRSTPTRALSTTRWRWQNAASRKRRARPDGRSTGANGSRQPEALDGPGRFALYTLKALAFISLRRDEQDRARDILKALKGLDPAGQVGWPVIAALADGL